MDRDDIQNEIEIIDSDCDAGKNTCTTYRADDRQSEDCLSNMETENEDVSFNGVVFKSDGDWDQIKRPLRPIIQKNSKGPKIPPKGPLFDILYGRLKRPLKPMSHCYYGQSVIGSSCGFFKIIKQPG
jgi:hypothetical protein